MTSHCITWHDTTQAITSHQMTWPSHDQTPQQTSRHQNTSLQSTKHHHHGTAEGSFTAKKWFGHRAGRSPCAHSIGKFFLSYIVLFLLETSAPGLSGHYWYTHVHLFVYIFIVFLFESLLQVALFSPDCSWHWRYILFAVGQFKPSIWCYLYMGEVSGEARENPMMFYWLYHGIHYHVSPPLGRIVWNFSQAPWANLTTCLADKKIFSMVAPRMYHWLCAGCLAKVEAMYH